MHFFNFNQRLLCLTWLFLFPLSIPAFSQIIISQYYEGTANDKYIEITNVSGIEINAQNSQFFICVFSNENAADPADKSPGLSTEIITPIPAGGSIIYKNSLAANPEYALPISIGALIGAFNGNDLIIISTTKDTSSWKNRIDVIGNSTSWGVDLSMVRKSVIQQPNKNFDPTEWETYLLESINSANPADVERLGFHFYDCAVPTIGSSSILVENLLDISLDLTWDSGNGNSRLVLLKQNEPIASLPASGTNYLAHPVFGFGDQIDNGYVVFNGWGNHVNISGLSPSSTYFVTIIEYGCNPPTYLNELAMGISFQTLNPIPRIMLDDNNLLDFGMIHPEQISMKQTVNLSWENLTDEISITTKIPFQLSLNGNDWSNSYIIPIQEDGNQSIDIRFSPLQANGIHQQLLEISSPGSDNITLNLAGTAFPNTWINEFHYDDVGADENEFIEVVLQHAKQYDLEQLSVQLYNGSNGEIYKQQSIADFAEGESVNDYSIFTWFTNGIQNGNPGGADGLAISIGNSNIQLISYEGNFTVNEGIAEGLTSIDIGIEESDQHTLEGYSLQLVNVNQEEKPLINALNADMFQWQQAESSPGSFNNNQTLPVTLTSFETSLKGNAIQLSWTTLHESQNLGFEVQKSWKGINFDSIGFVIGTGESDQPVAYLFEDQYPANGVFYRLMQIDLDGSRCFSKVVAFNEIIKPTPIFTLAPVPIKSQMEIFSRGIQANTTIKAVLFTIDGKIILQTKADLGKIKDQINKIIPFLQRGLYLLDLSGINFREKHIFLKE